MKRMKRLATILLTLCLVVPCIPFISHAANGQIMFTDPTAKTGEDVTVTGVVKTGGPDIGDANVTMKYDTTALQFVSGDNVTAGTDGTIVYDGKSSGGSTEHRFDMVFKVLKEGEAKIEVTDYKAYLASDEVLNCDKGNATVTAEKGTEPVADTTDTATPETTASGNEKVTVNEKEYTLSQTFADKDIPAGFKAAEITYNGAQVKMVQQESSGVYLGYLLDSANKGDFFLYNQEDATFSPFEQVMISDTTTIILLSDTKGLKLPSDYKSVTFSIEDSGNDFPAWQNTKTDGFYIVYAINSEGTKGFYQYDKNEGTYQRFEMPAVSETKKSTSMLGKVEDFMGDHLSAFILGAGLGLLILLVIVIIVAVKLHNRNSELDELYDEYGIDDEVETKIEPVKELAEEPLKEKKAIFASRKDQADEKFFEDEEFEEGEDDYADDYDEEEDDDDYESFETSKSRYDDEDDDFKVDFIDLDD